MLKRVGAAPITYATFFTDNSGKLFKRARCHSGLTVTVLFMSSEPTDATVSRRSTHYYGTCHGNGLSDSEGGVVRTFAKSRIVSGRMRILSPYDLYQKLKVDLDFGLREASTTEVGKYSGGMGTGQLLVAPTVDAVGYTNNQQRAPKRGDELSTEIY